MSGLTVANDNTERVLSPTAAFDLMIGLAVEHARDVAERAYLEGEIARAGAPEGWEDDAAATVLRARLEAMNRTTEDLATQLQHECGATPDQVLVLIQGRTAVFFRRIGELAAAGGHAPGHA